MLEFSGFAKILYSVLADGSKIEDFTKKLFLQITNYELEEDNPIYDLQAPTFKAYFNGRKGISQLAKKINAHVEPEKFVSYLEGYPDNVTDNLCKQLSPFDNEITIQNATEKCACLFRDIITAAAQSRRKTKKAVPTVRNDPKAVPEGISEDYKIQLLLECAGVCPNDNCAKPLRIESNGVTHTNANFIQIDSSLSSKDLNNLIALCPECREKYKLNHTFDQMQRLKAIKASRRHNVDALEIVVSGDIEEGLEQVLRRITALPPEQLVPLSYTPVDIRKKITNENKMIYIKVRAYVTQYFISVQNILQQLNQEGIFDFTIFAQQLRLNFLKLDKANACLINCSVIMRAAYLCFL